MGQKDDKNKKDLDKTKKMNNMFKDKNIKKDEDTNGKTKKVKTVKEKGKKKKEKKPSKHPKLKKAIKIFFILFFLLIFIGGGALVGYVFVSDEFKLTEADLLIEYSNSVILDTNGNLIATLSGDEKRKVINMSEMSEYLPKAFIAIEDERFESHNGVDIPRTLKSIATFILNGGKSSFGGSTITQQLVKNITDEKDNSGIKGAIRKVKEITRAYSVEDILSKDQILQLYLNILFVGGNNLHGVELGAQYYFNKTAKDLDLAESAFLAGINHQPNAYNPFTENNKEEIAEDIKIRTKTVLDKMEELGYITAEQYDEAAAKVDAGLPFDKGQVTTAVYSYHTEALMDQVVEQLVEERGWSTDLAKNYLYSGGLTIYSTQDSAIQTRMEEEFAKDTYIKQSRKTKLKDAEGNETDQYATSQASMVILDHTTGKVLGVVGGLGQKNTSFGLNRATMTPKATGSCMKPLAAVAPAIENNLITAASVFDDVPFANLKNYDGIFYGLSTTRFTIEVSHNIVPVKILKEVGYRQSIDFMRKMGISTLVTADENKEVNDEGNSLALGGLTKGVTTLEMAAAYGTIANDGVYITPILFTKVVDSNGNTVLEPKQETTKVMDPSNAYIVKNILTQPVLGSSGTATYCKIPGMDTAAKTGTTSDDFDRWLCGFTPYYSAATWYGYDVNETVRNWSTNPAGKLWDEVMTAIHKELPNKKFEVPSNIVRVSVCKDSGLLPTELCSNTANGDRVYTDVFVKGTQPTKRCNCHVQARVCQSLDEKEEPIFKLAHEYCTAAIDTVLITRPNSDTDTAWQKAKDARYMLPTDYCVTCVAPPEIEIPDELDPNSTNAINNVIDNSIGNVVDNTIDNEIGNTIGNVVENTVGSVVNNNI